MTGLSGAEGAAIDPLTGDFLFSTFGGGDRVIVVRGFAAPVGILGETPRSIPTSVELIRNSPNPFSLCTAISFSLPRSSHATLKVFNALGQEVATLVARQLPAGTHTTQWNASGLPGGVYLCRLQADGFVGVKKLLLVR